MSKETKFTAKICEDCYEERKTQLDEIFPTKTKIRSLHECYYCDDKTNWEFETKVSSNKEYKELELKIIYLKKEYI